MSHSVEKYWLDVWSEKWFKFITDNYPYTYETLSRNPNITPETVRNRHPDAWNYSALSRNPNIDMDFVLANIERKWNWYYLSCHKNITMGDIENNNFPWNWLAVCRNPNLTLSTVMLLHENEVFLDWDEIGCNPNITANDVITTHGILPWKTHSLSRNKNFNIAIMQKFGCQLSLWNRAETSRHPNITFTDIIQNEDILWDWDYVSENPNITIQNILDYPKKKWDWTALSCHKNITMNDIENNWYLPWNVYDGVSKNPNITAECIQTYPNWAWHWGLIARTLKTIDEHMDLIPYTSCKHVNIWQNPHSSMIKAITLETILNNQSLQRIWNWRHITREPKTTLKMILDNPDFPWDVDVICDKNCDECRIQYIEQCVMQTIITTICEYYKNTELYVDGFVLGMICAEMVFCNDYLVEHIGNY